MLTDAPRFTPRRLIYFLLVTDSEMTGGFIGDAEPVIERRYAPTPSAHPVMTNKSGASRACETPASFG